MAINVFYWHPTDKNFGHVALSIHGGAYISWWPAPPGEGESEFGNMLSSRAAASTMEADRTAEGTYPTWCSADITCLDEDAISRWWKTLSGRSGARADEKVFNLTPHGNYSGLINNCARVVLEAMKVGGLSRQPEAAAMAAPLSIAGTITPMDIKDIASALSGELGFWDKRRIETFSPRQRDAWTYVRTNL